jgi:hypothetical protein
VEVAIQCENLQKNRDRCGCSYTECSRRGNCCECVAAHLSRQELPGCAFPPEAEKTYDRSFKKFIEVWRKQLNLK